MSDPIADCHTHIIDPGRFHFADGAGYTPRAHESGAREELDNLLRRHGVSHALLVQPSCYAADNRAMLDAIARSGGRYKGIAVIGPNAPDRELAELNAQGVVGARLNLPYVGLEALAGPQGRRFLDRMREVGWFVEVTAGENWPAVSDILIGSGVRLLIDHFGEPDLGGTSAGSALEAVLRLGRETDSTIKLSAPYRVSRAPPPYPDLDPIAAAIVSTYGVDRCMWGSDWPFLGMDVAVDYGEQLGGLAGWVPDPADRRRVLWETPARLFGFVA
jgi:predicted TIM-barrel fold metal-dependent hydrolase